jgi:outer membrane putative beta-barrel porin/alpha-amylase
MKRTAQVAGVLCCACCASEAWSQELEPRAYSPAPTGVNFALFAGTRSSGEVLTDPSLPVENVEATIDAGVAAYGHTFAIGTHSASLALAVPYVWADISGDVGEDRRSVSRTGIADSKLRLAMNLIGGPALTPKEFAKRTPTTTLGVSLSITAPTGEYDSTKLINIGTNRWAFKPEIGVTIPHNRWMFDAYAGVWLFTDNSSFYGGVRREQEPMPTLQAHVSYTFRPGLWVAFDSTYYFGGETTVGGTRKADRKENSRAGLTLSVPLARWHALKFNWSEGASTRTGNDFTTYGVAYQYTWFNR